MRPAQITNSYATGAVTGSKNVELGGLVGGNFGTISQSYATGSVSSTGATSNGIIGGLVGLNGVTNSPSLMIGTITNSYATGAVTATGDVVAGGLVGANSSTHHVVLRDRRGQRRVGDRRAGGNERRHYRPRHRLHRHDHQFVRNRRGHHDASGAKAFTSRAAWSA